LAIDYRELMQNLHRSYDFTNKTVLFVGAGGRQLFDPEIKTKKVIAIDKDAAALAQLKSGLAAPDSQSPLSVLASRFEDVFICGDVVYFEFCLHEIDNPDKALAHARTLAPDIVVFDHSPESEWIFYTAEEHKIRRSVQATRNFGVERRVAFHTKQVFKDYAELLAKVAVQGPVAVQRVKRFRGIRDIVIPMDYEVVFLTRHRRRPGERNLDEIASSY
jgi:hypothetical protein